MRLPVLLGLALLAPAFAGCFESPGALVDPTYQLSREILLRIDGANVGKLDAEGADPYDFVMSSFVVTLGDATVLASALTLEYVDREGRAVSKPLSDLVGATTLTRGMQVRVDDANLTSGARLLLDGVPVADRERPPADWWTVGGYPVGVRMAPGAQLTYALEGGAHERFDIQGIESEEQEVRLDRILVDLDLSQSATLTLALAEALETVEAVATHSARPLAWSIDGESRMPTLVEASGTNLATGEAVVAGFETLDGTRLEYDARGQLWLNESGSPVRIDLDDGKVESAFDAVAWLTGLDTIDAETFSCAGKTRADACRPTEIPFDDLETSDTLGEDSEELDFAPGEVDAALLANLTRIFAEDLVPGDQVRAVVDLTSDDIPDYEAEEGAPESFDVEAEMLLRVVGRERVTVGGGTFDALKIVERLTLNAKTGDASGEGAPVLGPLELSGTFVENAFWLEEGTFVPLRIEYAAPFDYDRVLDELLGALDEEAWNASGLSPLEGDDVDLTLEHRVSFELTRKAGDVRLAPWAILGFTHSLASIGLGAMAIGVASSSTSETWGEGVPTQESDPWSEEPPVEPSLGLVQVAPSADSSVTLLVHETQGDLGWYQLTFSLDGAPLDPYYGEPATPSWCVLDPEGACAADPFVPIVEGDQVRITSDDLAGATLSVEDRWSMTTLLEMQLE